MVSGVMIHGVTFPVVRQQKSAWENCFFCDRKALKLKKLSQEKGEKSKRITLVQHRSEKNATGGRILWGKCPCETQQSNKAGKKLRCWINNTRHEGQPDLWIKNEGHLPVLGGAQGVEGMGYPPPPS